MKHFGSGYAGLGPHHGDARDARATGKQRKSFSRFHAPARGRVGASIFSIPLAALLGLATLPAHALEHTTGFEVDIRGWTVIKGTSQFNWAARPGAPIPAIRGPRGPTRGIITSISRRRATTPPGPRISSPGNSPARSKPSPFITTCTARTWGAWPWRVSTGIAGSPSEPPPASNTPTTKPPGHARRSPYPGGPSKRSASRGPPRTTPTAVSIAATWPSIMWSSPLTR